MTSLADVYEDNVGEVGSVRRLYAGTGLFVVGVVLTLAGIVAGGTNVLATVGVDVLGARKIAGVLGGVGFPAVLLGVFTVLPASNRVRGAAAIGASICVLGVALFWYAYPTYWVTSTAADTDLTLVVAAVYVFGAFTSIWTLFTAVVNFKTRNDPGGTIELRITQEGETRVVEVDEETAEAVREGERSAADLGGGVGMLGRQPDGNVETQTADPSSSSASTSANDGGTAGRPSQRQARRSKRAGAGDASATGGHPAASDGGATTQDISSPLDDHAGDGYDAEVLEDEPTESASTNHADRYCGNCEHFDYVQTNQGIQPYCGYHDEQMDDMEACDAWQPNN
ncbi:hypothetical protein [Halorubellus sp. PRR65]|uniref:DUF7139 domain-containing protein n=1 Tax=Halorubellus sp. PRR65 TaxID=3098148 RepID=UPI002B2633D5|nr:hypothetical protein [Halorubellus sp. PRR65]